MEKCEAQEGEQWRAASFLGLVSKDVPQGQVLTTSLVRTWRWHRWLQYMGRLSLRERWTSFVSRLNGERHWGHTRQIQWVMGV